MMTATSTSTPLLVRPQIDTPMAFGRVVHAYMSEAKWESARMLRSPGFAIPFLLLPAPVYLFFGVMLADAAVTKNPNIANYLFSGFAVFAVMGPALFGIGCALAVERDAGVLKLKRALPAPGGAYLVAKMLMGACFAALAMISLLVAALAAGRITLSAMQLTLMTVVMIVGSIPFGAIGLFIGAHASGSTAPAIANVVFLPMLWLSGLFIPLPNVLEPWAVIWPAFHLNQVALAAAGMSEFRFISPAIAVAVLVGVTALFGGLAIHRLARRE